MERVTREPLLFWRGFFPPSTATRVQCLCWKKKTWVGKIYRECRIIWRYLVLGQDRALLEVRRRLSLKLAPRMPLASM